MDKKKATIKRDLLDLRKVLGNAQDVTCGMKITERSAMWNNLIAVIRRDVEYALDDLQSKK